jgi:hypothetical protein
MSETVTTNKQYQKVIDYCKSFFEKKLIDYGTSWRILRPSSITDQIFIKAQRIRTIQENGIQKIEEGIEPEFMGIINYAIIGLIQLELEQVKETELELEKEKTMTLYNSYAQKAQELMNNKNHDYGEAWRDMRISSLTDLILMKIFRTKQIEDNQGKTLVSEGIDANYFDMINYSVFALIKLKEEKNNQ